MKNKYSKILNIIVTIGIILTVILISAMPFIMQTLSKSISLSMESNKIVVISLGTYICSIPYIIALLNLKRLCSLISDKNPFSHKIPKVINNIAYCAFSEVLLFNLMNVLLYFIYNIYFYGFTILVCVLVSFLSLAIGFFAIVSSKLFEKTIEIKDENDWTI